MQTAREDHSARAGGFVMRIDARLVAAGFTSGIPSDGIVDFLAMHGDVAGGINADPHFVTSNFHDSNADVVANNDRFVALTGQHKHFDSPSE
jgi:hypothetical protein